MARSIDLIEAAAEVNVRTAERFLANYERRHGSLEPLDASYIAAQRGEFASADEVARVFGGS
jgi:hypothetical protein